MRLFSGNIVLKILTNKGLCEVLTEAKNCVPSNHELVVQGLQWNRYHDVEEG